MIGGIADWILPLHGLPALAIVFLLPALEASAFLGFLFPGEIAVLLGGVLAFKGRVPLPEVMAAAVLGAIVGDTVGYVVGRRWGRRILRGIGRRIPFLRHRVDDHLDSARAYLQRRGGIAVFLGRFTAALRVMVPGLAGMAEMPYAEFAFYNAAGGLAWGVTFVLLGYFAGAAWSRVAGDASKVGLGLLVFVLLALVAARILRSVREHGEPVADRLARITPIAGIRHRFPRQSAWLARRIDTRSRRGFLLSFVLVAGTICGWVFGGITQDVVAREEVFLTDPRFERFIVAHRVEWMTAVMKIATWLGSNVVLIPLAIVIGASFVLWRRDWRPALLLAAALGGAVALYQVVKPLVGRPRPPVSMRLVTANGFSFPSGHATAAMAFWGMVAIVLSSGVPISRRILLWVTTMLIVALVAFSRVYLGVHWWTDVVAGIALGGLWLSVLSLAMVLRRLRS